MCLMLEKGFHRIACRTCYCGNISCRGSCRYVGRIIVHYYNADNENFSSAMVFATSYSAIYSYRVLYCRRHLLVFVEI